MCQNRLIAVSKKRPGALTETESELYDPETGEVYYIFIGAGFSIGAHGCCFLSILWEIMMNCVSNMMHFVLHMMNFHSFKDGAVTASENIKVPKSDDFLLRKR